MASPRPDDATPERVSPGLTGEGESKLGVNGHASPAPNTVLVSLSAPEKPTVNGGGDAHSPKAVNGDPKDVEMDEDATSPIAQIDIAVVQTDAPIAESVQPASPQDVDMAGTASADEASPSNLQTQDPVAQAASDAANPLTINGTQEAMEEQSGAKVVKDPSTSPSDRPDDPRPTTEDALPAAEVDLRPASLSQLAIDQTDLVTSPIAPGTDVTMLDVPSGKVAREREDDAEEAPPPKRARTEPREEEPTAVAPVPAAPDSTGRSARAELHALDDLPFWNDEELSSKAISPHQRNQIRKTIARIKKTKAGGPFKDSVQKLWPALWDSYNAKVDTPMDLSQIDRNLKDPDPAYRSFGDLKRDLTLIAVNTHTFNGPDHDITMNARKAVGEIWSEAVNTPDVEPSRAKSVPKTKPVREPRVATSLPGGGASSAQLVHTDSPKTAKGVDHSAADARRASTATEVDRPKRTVRAPKPKDIDYSTKPSRKKLRPELQFCDEILTDILNPKNAFYTDWFKDAVDAEGLGIPTYYSVIKKPMDLGKVSRMLAGGEITTLKDFDRNIRLIFLNCYQFNGHPDEMNPVSVRARQLEEKYESMMKNKDDWLARHARSHPPPTSASNASDDEDDEDEEDDEDTGLGPDPLSEVRVLETKLREEMTKQAELFSADDPNASMIQIQQGIVNVVQDALLKAKQKLIEFRQKSAGKGGKKAPKPAKSKPAGVARKAQSAAAPVRKAGPAKNKKKNLTNDDKNRIAEAINDLDGPFLDRAIDIIKRDTGQNEDDNGELELDIESLSPEALLKLWELCKKALPGFGKDSVAAPDSSPEAHRGAAAKQSSKPQQQAAKPKKNKPMTAQEQEARIAQLREIRERFKPGQEPGDDSITMQAESPMNDDSSDDSSEEE